MKIFANICYWFFKILTILEILITWDSSLIAPFILNLLLKTICFYLLSCMRDSVSRKSFFCLKPGKHDVTLTSFTVDVSVLTRFHFVKMCQIEGLEDIENLVMIR